MGETLDYLEANAEELGGEAAGFPTRGHIVYNPIAKAKVQQPVEMKGSRWPVCVPCQIVMNCDWLERKCWNCGTPLIRMGHQSLYIRPGETYILIQGDNYIIKSNPKPKRKRRGRK
jgi:hypothetical protein